MADSGVTAAGKRRSPMGLMASTELSSFAASPDREE